MSKRIYGFPKTKYNREYINSLTDHQKEEHALEDEDIIIYDDEEQFLTDVNDNLINNLEVYWTASKN